MLTLRQLLTLLFFSKQKKFLQKIISYSDVDVSQISNVPFRVFWTSVFLSIRIKVSAGVQTVVLQFRLLVNVESVKSWRESSQFSSDLKESSGNF